MTGVIGRGTWIDKLAHELVEREKSLGRNLDMIRVESGLGASGIPHIGSIGDAVRAYGVKLALQDAGYRSELIAYSDDLDGLRKVPEGMPGNLEEHIAKPVSMIPDPYGCHDSYGAHMSGMLLEGLDKIGIRYEFRRAADTYGQGLMAGQIHAILCNSTRIGARIAEMVGQSKYETSLPYFAVCGNCGRLYTTKSLEYMEDERRVKYECTGADIGGAAVPGCGHEGEADISGSPGKLAWKVEFAARWAAFDVRFEAYGKDIMDSVRINDWVSDEILGHPHPHHAKYEMFLDKGGKKISKSAGNVITAQRWLEFGTPQSLLLLLYKRITGARELGLGDIPGLMNEYAELEDVYFGRTKVENPAKLSKSRGLYEYVNLLEPPGAPGTHVNYALAAELARIYKEDRIERVSKKLAEYGAIKGRDADVDTIISLAGRYADEFDRPEQAPVEIDGAAKDALREIAAGLADAEDVQGLIYEAARSNGVQPRDLFRILYQIILGTTRGPRIGPFISDIGASKVAAMISRHT